MSKTRVLVVDNSVKVRRLLTDAISSDSEFHVIAAANGHIALAKVPNTAPDIVILDIKMADGDGIGTLLALRAAYPHLPVIVFSTPGNEGRTGSGDIFSLGAADCVLRPVDFSGGESMDRVVHAELIPRIRLHTAGRQRSTATALKEKMLKPDHISQAHRRISAFQRTDVLAIGVSTGGPNALVELLQSFSSDFPVPVLIVQHIPPSFTGLLAERLDSLCQIHVSEAASNQIVTPGTACIAPGDFHMAVRKYGNTVRIHTYQGPPENSCRPSADVLFRSAADVYGPHVLAVVLTGMGQDGLRGCERIRDAGGRILVQDEASSVVWGMPGFVAKAGLADKVLPLSQLAKEIEDAVWYGRSNSSAAAASRSTKRIDRCL